MFSFLSRMIKWLVFHVGTAVVSGLKSHFPATMSVTHRLPQFKATGPLFIALWISVLSPRVPEQYLRHATTSFSTQYSYASARLYDKPNAPY